jgi:acyl homoserine lactone synthase
MILAMEEHHHAHYHDLRSAMYRLREGWLKKDIDLKDPREISHDALDDTIATNLLYLSDKCEVLGAARIMQTTGPHALSDPLAALMDNEAPIRSPSLWEASWFCADVNLPVYGPGETKEGIFRELLLAVVEMCCASGIASCLCIMNRRAEKFISLSGIRDLEVLKRKMMPFGMELSVSIFDCSPSVVADLRKAGSIDGNIWSDSIFTQEPIEDPNVDMATEMAQLLSDAMKGSSPEDFEEKLKLYCAQQLIDARTQHERDQAQLLMTALGKIIKSQGSGPRAA